LNIELILKEFSNGCQLTIFEVLKKAVDRKKLVKIIKKLLNKIDANIIEDCYEQNST